MVSRQSHTTFSCTFCQVSHFGNTKGSSLLFLAAIPQLPCCLLFCSWTCFLHACCSPVLVVFEEKPHVYKHTSTSKVKCVQHTAKWEVWRKWHSLVWPQCSRIFGMVFWGCVIRKKSEQGVGFSQIKVLGVACGIRTRVWTGARSIKCG